MIDFRKLLHSFTFAFKGLFYVVKKQNNARFHFFATIVVICIGFWVRLNNFEWSLISIAIGLVWIAECFNTAIEKFFDLIEPNQNQLVRIGKDTAAAAVLITALVSVVLGLLILGPALVSKFRLMLN